MSNKIFEELPARKFAPAGPSSRKDAEQRGPSGGEGSSMGMGRSKDKSPGSVEEASAKRVRQAVYDIRYRARREGIDLKTAFSQYMQNSSMPQAERDMVKVKLFGKNVQEEIYPYNLAINFLVSEGYAYSFDDACNIMMDLSEDTINQIIEEELKKEKEAKKALKVKKPKTIEEASYNDVDDTAIDIVSNALYRVFVEDYKNDGLIYNAYLDEMQKIRKSKGGGEDKLYQVRVTDKNSGRSYVRYATRQKITELRANPNIASVEMTEYGEPYEGEKAKGEITAKVKAKKDWDKDGKIESPAKEYRGVVHNAIQKAKGLPQDGRDTSNVREDYLHEKVHPTKDQTKRILTGNNVNNRGLIKLFPDDGQGKGAKLVQASYDMSGHILSETAKSEAQQRFMGMVYAAKKGAKPMSKEVAKAVESMSTAEAKKFASTKHKGLPKHVAKESTEFTGPGEIPCFGIDPTYKFGVGGSSSKGKKSSKKEEEDDVDTRHAKTSSSLLKTKLRYYGSRI